jgi:phosphatidylserine/phosphatidylglycerophosphate/cardiolipin synthase-like enzyme
MNLVTNNLNKNYLNLIAFSASKEDNSKVVTISVPEQKKAENETSPLYIDPKIVAGLLKLANERGMFVSELIKNQFTNGVEPEKSVTSEVGKTNVTTLIDGQQIFSKALDYIQKAEKIIQVEMFEFQNKDDVDKHPFNGAETVGGSKEQQQIYDELIKKSKEGVKVQVILDSSKWPAQDDGKGGKGNKFYNNLNMVKRLLDAGVDVAIYPRASQGGTKIQHVKLLAVDSNKIIIGGENWGNHSPVNHDACVAIETIKDLQKNPEGNSEVDNIIDAVFNKDWKFTWRMMGLYGAMTKEEQNSNLKIIKKILPEAAEYMELVGDIYKDPKYTQRFTKGEFYLPEVKPVKDSAIKVLINSPIEYKTHRIYDKDTDNESIRTYLLGKKDENGQEIKGKLDDPNVNYLRAELFVLSHKEIVQKIIERHKAGTLDAKILVSPDLLQKFTYLDKPYRQLRMAGVPVEAFKVNEELNQRLHCKWAVLGHKEENKPGNKPDNLELLIGSANWSAMGIENNSYLGVREDYQLHHASILKDINSSFKSNVKKFEDIVKQDPKLDETMKSIFTPRAKEKGRKKVLSAQDLLMNLRENKKILNSREKALFTDQADNNHNHNDESLKKIRTLLGHYQLVEEYLKKLSKYKRGNHEAAIVIPNQTIAGTFVKQFEKDWNYTINKKETISFNGNSRLQNKLCLPIKSNSPIKLDLSGRIFNKVV